jgi:hypothetical protein
MTQRSTRRPFHNPTNVTILAYPSRARDAKHQRRHMAFAMRVFTGCRSAMRSLGGALREHGADLLPQGTLGMLRSAPFHAD